MNTLVMKFGGTSLMTTERIKSAAEIAAQAASGGKRIVVVVSAMGHTTDELLKLADGVTAMPDQRELDALMATGEQVSATLMTMALQALGLKSRSFNGGQAGIATDGRFGDAKIEDVNLEMLTACLNDGCIPVVTGFQGVSATGETTTLGRGGSDTTAIALAAFLKAERCDIYTDVDGVYTADPRTVNNAVRLDRICVSEMIELARSGAQVLNARSVEVAREKQVAVRVRSTFNPSDEGTLVTAHDDSKSREITGIAVNTNVNCIQIDLEKLELGPDRKLRTLHRRRWETRRHMLQLLSEAGITAEIANPIKPNPFRILVFLKKSDSVAALTVLQNAKLPVRDMKVNTDLASVSLVAREITAKHEVNAIETMKVNDVPSIAIAWYRQRLTLLVPHSLVGAAANALHLQFAAVELVA